MYGDHGRMLLLVTCLAAIGWAGCAGPSRGWRNAFLPFGRDRTDTVPGLLPPQERIALLRKMGKKAASANPAEQERISGELAQAFRVETDPLTRLEIIRAISGCPTPAAASVLEAGLADSNADIRVAACNAWGRRGGPEAAARLSEVLASDIDMDVRLTAAMALGETGDARAAAALGEALEDRDPAMQYVAVRSLREVTGEDLGNDVNRWREYVRGELPSSSSPVSVAERPGRPF